MQLLLLLLVVDLYVILTLFVVFCVHTNHNKQFKCILLVYT